MYDVSSRETGDGLVFNGREYTSLADLTADVSRLAQEAYARDGDMNIPVFEDFRKLFFALSPDDRKITDIRRCFHIVTRLRETAERERLSSGILALISGFAFPGGDRRFYCAGRVFESCDDFGVSLIQETSMLTPDTEYLESALKLLFNGVLISYAEFAEGNGDLVARLREARIYISETPGNSFQPEDPFLNAEPWLKNGVWQVLYLGYRLSAVRKFRLGASVYLTPRDFEEAMAVLQKRSREEYQDFLRRHKHCLLFLCAAFPETETRQLLEARLSSITAAVFGDGEYRFRNGTHFNHFVDSLLRKRRYYEIRKIFTCYGLGLYEADREVWHTSSYFRLSDALSQGFAPRRFIADIQNRIMNKGHRKPVTINGVTYQVSDEEIARRKHETLVNEIYYPDGEYPPDYRKPFGGMLLPAVEYFVILSLIVFLVHFTLEHAGVAERPPEKAAQAAAPQEDPKAVRKTADQEVVSFGRYPQSGGGALTKVEWYQFSSEGNTLLLISRKCLDLRPYHDQYSDTSWGTSNINKWLNHDFLMTAFTAAERDALETSMIPEEGAIGAANKGTSGKFSRDRVFLLSSEETARYLNTPEMLLCEVTDYARNRLGSGGKDRYGSWWLRNRGSKGYSALTVSFNGQVAAQGSNVFSKDVFVRPAVRVGKGSFRRLKKR